MMKKALSQLLIIMMLLSLFTACGSTQSSAEFVSAEPSNESAYNEHVIPQVSSDDKSSVTGATAETPSYTIPISDEPLTYSIWLTYAPFAADLINTETMEGLLVLDTIQDVSNIHFDVTAANGAAEQDNFNLMIAAGDYCDILTCMSNYSTGLEGAVDDGIIQDLADVLPEKCPIYWSNLSQNTNTLMQSYTDAGYMPSICVITPEVAQEVVGPVLRKDWLDEFGMDMPKTFDDLYAYLEQAKNNKGAILEAAAPDGLNADLAYGENLFFQDLTVSDPFVVIDGEVKASMVQDGFRDYLSFMNKLYENNIIQRDFYTESSEDLGVQARINFGLGTNSLISIAANNTSDVVANVTDPDFEMAVMDYVSTTGTTGNHVGPTSMIDTMKDKDTWSFSTECSNIDPLLQLVEFLYSDDGYMLTNYGVEGITYTMVDGTPQYTDLICNNPDGLSYFFASYVYASNAATGFFPYINDMSRTYYNFNDNQWQVYEDLRTLSDCAYNYPAYAKMNTEESTTYATLDVEISTYTDTRILEFITGAADIDSEFDAFKETLYGMGLQRMIDLKQDAYDRALERAGTFSAQ